MADQINADAVVVVGDPAAAEAVAEPAPPTLPEGTTNMDLVSAKAGEVFTNQTQNDPAVNFASNLVGDPSAFFSDDTKLSSNVPTVDPAAAGTNINANDSKYNLDPNRLNARLNTGQTSTVSRLLSTPDTATYNAATTVDRVSQPQNQVTAATGDVRDEAIIDAPQADIKGLATGTNEDGTTNYTGKLLNQYASLNVSNVIDTSTVSGKLLADSLGDGNYVDSKATLKGQLDTISKDFVDPITGETKIPTWAAGTARSVSRIAAFKGVTGTAATAAMAQAIMEASIPVAQADSQFFQTVTLKNLDNKQQQIINTANVLSKMEMANLDYRMNTAVENSKNFMQMDLTNLQNEQQARVVNTQARVQSILEDAKAENTKRMFVAESTNDLNKYYDNLNTSIKTFNASQKNSMEQFNAGEANTLAQFNSNLENNREQFYRDMQYNIDVANTKWRQTVTLTNTEMQFQAAATDVKNMVDLSTEQLNQLWDRADSILDYTWKSAETAADRENQLAVAKMNADAAMAQASATRSAGKSSATGSIIGSIAGASIIAF
jgi:hypothetical protein